MPQIWLTYDELAVLMKCDPIAARAVTAMLPLDRRRSRDGQARAKLSPSLAEAFMESQAHLRVERVIDGCAGDLTAITTAWPPRPRQSARRRAVTLPRRRSPDVRRAATSITLAPCRLASDARFRRARAGHGPAFRRDGTRSSVAWSSSYNRVAHSRRPRGVHGGEIPSCRPC